MPKSEASLDDLSSDTSYDADEDYRLAQQEWEESLQQLHQLLTVVLMPFLGKWLGRRWSYWGQSYNNSLTYDSCSYLLFRKRMLATYNWVLGNPSGGDTANSRRRLNVKQYCQI
jgi:hypothetical protein